jgi:filamentous hemagglutinin family protein
MYLKIFLVSLLALIYTNQSFALPHSSSTRAGIGLTSAQTTGNKMSIEQHSNFAVNHWESFNVAAGEEVEIIQPSENSVYLALVTGGRITNIGGTIRTNGRLIIGNSAGLYFSQGAVVDTHAFVSIAGQIDIDDIENLDRAGNGEAYNLNIKTTSGINFNAGTITANGSKVVFIAAVASNVGTVTANDDIEFAVGSKFRLTFLGERIGVEATGEQINAWIENEGILMAGGKIRIAAYVEERLRAHLVNVGDVDENNLFIEDTSIKILINGTLDDGFSFNAKITSRATGEQLQSVEQALLNLSKNFSVLPDVEYFTSYEASILRADLTARLSIPTPAPPLPKVLAASNSPEQHHLPQRHHLRFRNAHSPHIVLGHSKRGGKIRTAAHRERIRAANARNKKGKLYVQNCWGGNHTFRVLVCGSSNP